MSETTIRLLTLVLGGVLLSSAVSDPYYRLPPGARAAIELVTDSRSRNAEIKSALDEASDHSHDHAHC